MVLLHLLSNIDINLNGKKSKGRHWVTLLIDRNKAVYFRSFGTQYILQEILDKDKSIIHSIFRMPDDDSILCGFDCIASIEQMLAGKALLDYTYLISQMAIKRMTK